MSDDAPLLPPPDDTDDIQVVTTIRRAPRRMAPVVHAAPPPALPAPATPHRDPIEHILPHGSIATLSGASGVGKTALTAGIIRDLQQGKDFYGHKVNVPPSIGYVAADRPWRDHQQWFTRAGCQPFPHYSLPDDKTFDWNRFRKWEQCAAIFCEALDKLALPPGSVVIVDPLPLFIPGRLIDYKDAAIGVRVLDAVGLQPRQLTMIGIFHVAKQKANKNDRYLRPQDRILGSGGQVGYSETAMYLMGPEDIGQPYSEFGWVPHQIKAEKVNLKRDALGLFVPYDEYDQAIELATAARALQYFQDGQVHAASIAYAGIAKALGVSTDTARGYVQDLTSSNALTRVSRGHYQLTSAVIAAMRGEDPGQGRKPS
jgi:hypothetical protein